MRIQCLFMRYESERHEKQLRIFDASAAGA